MPDAVSSYRFAGFELRPRDRMLLNEGEPLAVGPRAFDVLVALVERAGKLVTKDELFDRVWPKLVVEENNLQVQVSALRKLVGQEAIATVPGHGYRFTADVQALAENAPASVRPRPQGLPCQATTFVGRGEEARECARLLGQTRLLTLVGVGGIGKTRLSLEVAAAASEGFTDGAAFVDLAPVADAAAVVDVTVSALGVTPSPGQSLKEALLQQVASRRQLIILDNCEHLLTACAELAAELLRTSPASKLMVTSREPLRTAGEAVYQVPALAAPAAAALFVERARAIHPQFTLMAQDGDLIARICRELDGIPLALELAAARLRVMSLEAVAAHLSERFRLLVSGDRAALPRQRTLRAAIDWSYELLAPGERALLRRLSVFAGGFEVDAAEAVGAGDDVASGDVLYLLADLSDKSLVAFDPRGSRYRLLETVRQYAQERLAEAGEETPARDAHLSFYVTFGAQLMREVRGPRQNELIARVHSERDNIVAAFAHAREAQGGGQAGLVMVYGTLTGLSMFHLDLACRLAREALAHPDAQAEDTARGRALYTAGWMDFFAGRYEEARNRAEAGVRIARACNDRQGMAEGLYRLGNACVALGRTDEAKRHFEEEIALARELGSAALASEAHGSMSEMYWQMGMFDLAQQCLREAFAAGSPDPDFVTTGNLNLARNAITLREQAAAIRHLRAGLAALSSTATVPQIQLALVVCGGAALLRGEAARALRYFGAAAAQRQCTGWRNCEPDFSFIERSVVAAREMAGQAADTAYGEGLRMDAAAAEADARAWVDLLPPASPVLDEPMRAPTAGGSRGRLPQGKY